MTGRLLVLLALVALGLLLLAAYSVYRRRVGATPERLDVADFGLELMEGCCAFIVFTTPACRPCRAALQVVEESARASRGLTEVRKVDAVERPELAARYDVRTVPTIFLITASGHVVNRWRSVPDAEAVSGALAEI